MKNLILIIVTAILLCAVTSCTKCVKCTEKTVNDTLIVEYPETCGNWRIVAKFEEHVHEQALKESNVVCIQKSKIPLVDSY